MLHHNWSQSFCAVMRAVSSRGRCFRGNDIIQLLCEAVWGIFSMNTVLPTDVSDEKHSRTGLRTANQSSSLPLCVCEVKARWFLWGHVIITASAEAGQMLQQQEAFTCLSESQSQQDSWRVSQPPLVVSRSPFKPFKFLSPCVCDLLFRNRFLKHLRINSICEWKLLTDGQIMWINTIRSEIN